MKKKSSPKARGRPSRKIAKPGKNYKSIKKVETFEDDLHYRAQAYVRRPHTNAKKLGRRTGKGIEEEIYTLSSMRRKTRAQKKRLAYLMYEMGYYRVSSDLYKGLFEN